MANSCELADLTENSACYCALSEAQMELIIIYLLCVWLNQT